MASGVRSGHEPSRPSRGFVRVTFPQLAIGLENMVICRESVVNQTTDGPKRTARYRRIAILWRGLGYGVMIRRPCRAHPGPGDRAFWPLWPKPPLRERPAWIRTRDQRIMS